MPSRPHPMVSAFQPGDPANEVICPLNNQDGSSCRKRCIGEKRYRSMQEHIRRAHPAHYIPKLPATEESFNLMINTNPTAQQQAPTQNSQSTAGSSLSQPQRSLPPPVDNLKAFPPDRRHFGQVNHSRPGTPQGRDEYIDYISGSALGGDPGPMASANAAATLAQLSHPKITDNDWDPESGWHSDTDGGRRIPRSNIELPPIQHVKAEGVTSEPFSSINSGGRGFANLLSNSPPGRSSTLPPIQRLNPSSRQRNKSISKRGVHRKKNSKGSTNDWIRRIQNDDRLRPPTHERKAQSAEPSADYGKRWEDLIDAAASATEDIDDDRTPAPQSPVSVHRASLPPPFNTQAHFQPHVHDSYTQSPLNQALTPPPGGYVTEPARDPFPSVEGAEGAENSFHMETHALMAHSSPSYPSHQIQIYCAMCHNVSLLRESLACTECICGICQKCVSVLMEEQGARRKCPRCATIGGRFKPFQLDIR